MDEINFQNPIFCSGLGFPLWGSWYLVYWGRQNARLWSVTFPSVPLVWIKILPVCCALDTGSSAVLAVAPPSLETSGIFLNSGVRYTHFYVFATEIAQIRCIQLQLRYRVDFSAFRMPDTTLDPIFRRRLLHFWSDLKNNLPSNLANLSTSKWISGTRKILVFGVPHMELLISRELRPHRDTFGVYGFPRYHWFTIQFLLSAVRRTREISQRFGSGSVHVRNFWNDSQQHSPLHRHLWLCHKQRGDPLYINGGFFLHYRYYTKRSPWHLARSRPCVDRGQIEPTSVFCVATDTRLILSRSVDLRGNGGRKKPVFWS